MQVVQKWQDVTLMNSKCSEATEEGEISIARVVLKNLKDNSCNIHNQPYRFYYDRKLMCPSCFANNLSQREELTSEDLFKKYSFVCSLDTLLNHPILLLIDCKQLDLYPFELIELIITSYKHIYEKKSDFRLQKSLVQSFISRLRSRVDHFCDEVLSAFNQMQENLSKQTVLKQELASLNAMYEGQLLEMLRENFVQSKKQELESILTQYSSSNESPFAKIKQNMEQMMSAFAEQSLVNVAALQKIFVTVTDQILWNPKSMIVSRENYSQQKFQRANMIITNDQIQLQKQYILKIFSEKLELLMQGQAIGSLDVRIDSLYTLPNFKLLGVNYNKLFIINYFDQLTIQEQYSVQGCTDVLPFPNHIVAVSNQNLIKINVITREVCTLGTNYTDLKYCRNKPYLFACQNQHGITTYWNVWSDKPQVLWF